MEGIAYVHLAALGLIAAAYIAFTAAWIYRKTRPRVPVELPPLTDAEVKRLYREHVREATPETAAAVLRAGDAALREYRRRNRGR